MSDSVSAWIWAGLTFAIGLIWIRRHFDINRAQRDAVLTPADANIDGDLPALSLLVAAKDEEENIARCAEGLLAQVSYMGRVDVGFTVDPELVPDAWQLAEEMPRALTELLSAARQRVEAEARAARG